MWTLFLSTVASTFPHFHPHFYPWSHYIPFHWFRQLWMSLSSRDSQCEIDPTNRRGGRKNRCSVFRRRPAARHRAVPTAMHDPARASPLRRVGTWPIVARHVADRAYQTHRRRWRSLPSLFSPDIRARSEWPRGSHDTATSCVIARWPGESHASPSIVRPATDSKPPHDPADRTSTSNTAAQAIRFSSLCPPAQRSLLGRIVESLGNLSTASPRNRPSRAPFPLLK